MTNLFHDEPVNDPENRSIGVSFRNGGYMPPKNLDESVGSSRIDDASHWLFDGTGLHDGDFLGEAVDLVAVESDGTVFEWVNGQPVVTDEDGTPLDFQILGHSPVWFPNRRNPEKTRYAHATMGIFDVPGVGTIFNAATLGWVRGLWSDDLQGIPDPQVSTITYNALARLFGMNVVPMPSAAWMGLALLATIGLGRLWTKHRV